MNLLSKCCRDGQDSDSSVCGAAGAVVVPTREAQYRCRCNVCKLKALHIITNIVLCARTLGGRSSSPQATGTVRTVAAVCVAAGAVVASTGKHTIPLTEAPAVCDVP